MKVGLNSFAYRWNISKGGMDVYSFLDEAVSLGADIVQICENLPYLSLSNDELLAIKEKYSSSLEIQTGFRARNVDEFRKALSAADCLGAKETRVILEPSVRSEVDLDNIISVLKCIECDLRTYGIKLMLENHFLITPDEYAYILRSLDSDCFGICFDCFNSIAINYGTKETFRILSPYIRQVHVKDVQIARVGTSFVVSGCALGSGLLNLDELFGNTFDISDKFFFIESWIDLNVLGSEPFDAEKTLNAQSYETLKRRLK